MFTVLEHFSLQVFYYSTGVFIGAGIPENRTQYAVLGTGFINVLMTGISVSIHIKDHLNL